MSAISRVIAFLLLANIAVAQDYNVPFRPRSAGGGGGGGDAAIGVHLQAELWSTETANLTTGSFSPQAGSTIVCGMALDNLAVTTTSVTSSVSCTWQQAGSTVDYDSTSDRRLELWYCPNFSGGSTTITHTRTVPNGAAVHIACVELQGVDTSSVLDQVNGSSDVTSPYDSPSITTTTTNSALVGWAVQLDTGQATMSTPSGWTMLESQDGFTLSPFGLIARIVSSTGSYSYSYTRSNTDATVNMIASFKDTN